MFRLKKIKFLVIVVAIVIGLISCDNNDDDEEVDIQIIGDVFVLKKIIDEKTQYRYSYYLYGNYPLSSANVITPTAETIPLLASDQLSLVFSVNPYLGDYSETLPQNGLYNFNAKHLDQEFSEIDNLDFIDIDIPQITSTEYLSSLETFKIEWNTVSGADSYIVRMIDNDNNVFFTGYLLDEDATSYEINQSTGTWSELPGFKHQLLVELHATRYEQNTNELEIYNVEEVSIGVKQIFWGVN